MLAKEKISFYPPSKLVAPLFIDEKTFNQPAGTSPEPLQTIPHYQRLNQEQALKEIESLSMTGIRNFIIYPLVDHDTIDISGGVECLFDKKLFHLSFTENLKKLFPDISITLDLCLCHFNKNSQCGISTEGVIDSDATNQVLNRLAILYAQAGADALMISGMIDGTVASIRKTLEQHKFSNIALLAQSAKFDSPLYGPFQRIKSLKAPAAQKSSYQISPTQRREAIREILLDQAEGADIIVLKPTSLSLDLIDQLRNDCLLPLLSYMTGGEYAMLSASLPQDKKQRLIALNHYFCNLERAGVDAIVSYSAAEYARLLKEYRQYN